MEEKKKEEKTKKDPSEALKDLWKTPRGRAIVFFVFYFIFFLVLILFMRTNHNSQRTNNFNEIQTGVNQNLQANFKLDKLEEGNYHFVREENRNGVITTFVGDTANNRSEVMMTQGQTYKHYFLYSDIVLEQENGVYKVGVNPYLYPNITASSSIRSILSQATLKSKTEYEAANTIYQYEISTSILVKILDQQDIDLDDPVNTIQVEVDGENELVGITYDLNSYQVYKTNGSENNLTIAMHYSDFGKIEEMEIPE